MIALIAGFILICFAVFAVWVSTILYIALVIFVCGVVSLAIWFAAYLQPRTAPRNGFETARDKIRGGI